MSTVCCGTLTQSRHSPCCGLREASQVEQSPRRGLLSRVLYRTTATRICIRSGWACATQSHEHNPAQLPRESPAPPAGTQPVPSSCQGACNTRPSLTQPLTVEHTPAPNLSNGEGAFPGEALLQECSAQRATVRVTVQPRRLPWRTHPAVHGLSPQAPGPVPLPSPGRSREQHSPSPAPGTTSHGSQGQRHQTSEACWDSPGTRRAAGEQVS